MHFIGNNSLSLHHPEEHRYKIRPLYLTYSAGWTVLSLVVSCTVMTAAFFIMGYEIHDLRRMLGFQSSKETEDTDSEGMTKSEADEDDVYSASKQTWKEEKKRSAKATVASLKRGMGDIITKSAKVASWTMLDSGKFTLSGTSASERKPKQLYDEAEAEFRGPAARQNSVASSEHVVPMRRTEEDQSSIALGPLSSSFVDVRPCLAETDTRGAPLSSLPVAIAARRGSLPFALQQGPPPSPSSAFFTPGYSFPPPASSAPPIDDATPPWLRMPEAVLNPGYTMADAQPVDAKVTAFRRASLPAVSFPPSAVTKSDRDTVFHRGGGGLTRIQSLSEHENDLQPVRSRSSHDSEVDDIDESERVKAVLDTVPKAERKPDDKQLRRRRAEAWLAAFLGLDVVTKGEILKIVITGFIAGLGIAGMRKYFVSLVELSLTPTRLHRTAIDHWHAVYRLQGWIRYWFCCYRLRCCHCRSLHHVRHASPEVEAFLVRQNWCRVRTGYRRLRYALYR